MRSLVSVVVLGSLLSALAACESPRFVDGAQPCAAGPTPCPDDYYCGADQRCWKSGSGPDGGAPTDAGTSDGSTPCGALRGCPDGATLCESFEGQTPPPDVLATTDARLTLDLPQSGSACRGQQALHAHVDGGSINYAEASWYPPAPFAQPSDPLYVRAFFFVPTAPALPTTHGVTLMQLQQGTANSDLGFSPSLNVEIDGGRLLLYDEQTSTSSPYSAGQFPRDRWVCVELEVAGLQTGHPKLAASLNDSQVIAPFSFTFDVPDKLSFGVVNVPNDVPVDVWVDDVAVAPFRIGCVR